MKNKVLLSLITALLALSSFLMGKLGVTPTHLSGGVPISSEYVATSTNTQALFANYQVIRRGYFPKFGYGTSSPTTLGSVIITTTGTAPMCIYDATSTVTNAEWATSTIVCFGASPTVGNYTFDVIAQKGLLVEFQDAAGKSRASTTITYR